MYSTCTDRHLVIYDDGAIVKRCSNVVYWYSQQLLWYTAAVI